MTNSNGVTERDFFCIMPFHACLEEVQVITLGEQVSV